MEDGAISGRGSHAGHASPQFFRFKWRVRADGTTWICCPRCRTWQPLSIKAGEYSIDNAGRIYPEWVCMEPARKCQTHGILCIPDLANHLSR